MEKMSAGNEYLVGQLEKEKARSRQLEENIQTLLNRVGVEVKACECGVKVWMVKRKDGKIFPIAYDGEPHQCR